MELVSDFEITAAIDTTIINHDKIDHWTQTKFASAWVHMSHIHVQICYVDLASVGQIHILMQAINA